MERRPALPNDPRKRAARAAHATPIPSVYLASGGASVPGTSSSRRSFVFVDSRVTIIPDVTTFFRGDSNADGAVDLSDPIGVLTYLFQGGAFPACMDAADANDDGRIDITDPIAVLGSLYLEGVELPAPGAQRGVDPTPDSLGCAPY